MSYTSPTVNYATTFTGTYTTLTGVQSVVIRRGRQRFQDPIAQSVCTIDLIPANSYATPLAIGQFIDVRATNSSSATCYFFGRITDVTRTYDIPYNSSTGAAPGDRISITATGPVGMIGSAVLDSVGFGSGTDASDAADEIVMYSGVLYFSEPSGVKTSNQLLDGPALDNLNTVLQTGQLLIDDLDTSRALDLFVYIYKNSGTNTAGFSYSDTAATRFTRLEYESSAQSTFNFVKVLPEGGEPQIASSGTGPYNSLEYNTFNQTNADALTLANYLYNLFSAQVTPVPFVLSTDTNVAASCMDVAVLPNSSTFTKYLGQVVNITFRGTTVAAQILGIEAGFFLDRAVVQLFLAPSLGVPFTLDSTTNGVLDQNRLGYP